MKGSRSFLYTRTPRTKPELFNKTKTRLLVTKLGLVACVILCFRVHLKISNTVIRNPTNNHWIAQYTPLQSSRLVAPAMTSCFGSGVVRFPKVALPVVVALVVGVGVMLVVFTVIGFLGGKTFLAKWPRTFPPGEYFTTTTVLSSSLTLLKAPMYFVFFQTS